MTKLTLNVCKVYKNTGLFRFHRKKTKQYWKHYFIGDETGEWKFNTEWVNPIKARFLKHKRWKLHQFICEKCLYIFEGYVKNSRQEIDCPRCED